MENVIRIGHRKCTDLTSSGMVFKERPSVVFSDKAVKAAGLRKVLVWWS